MRRDVLANGRGRWLVIGASIVISAGMLYAQVEEPPCCGEIAAARPSAQAAAPAGVPNVATPA
ncbi:MAG: glycoside hydrolase, partial [Mycobacterium sp.]